MIEHPERLEASLAARIEAAKARLRLLQLVLTAFVEGLSRAETARRIQRSYQTVWRAHLVLGLETGRRWETTGKRTGRRDSKKALLEVRP